MYKRLLTDIILRIILLTCTLLALVYFWISNRDPLILLNILALLAIQVFLFVRSQNRVNRKLRNFFEAFRFDDLGLSQEDGFRDKSFRELYAAMAGLLDKNRQMSLESRRQKEYFQTVTEHAGVGILAFGEQGEIRLANRTLKELLGIPGPSSLEELDRLQEGLSGQLRQMQAGERKLVRLSIHNPSEITGESRMQLFVGCTEIKLEKERIRILTFQNIQQELEANEVEAWQRVIRVLTHEIMNSAGPIASSAQTLLELLEEERSPAEEESSRLSGLREDLIEGLKIIRERSTGMEEFVQQFRKVTLLPEPKLEKIMLGELFQGISVLFEKRLKEGSIDFQRNLESPEMVLYADRKLVEQALINLMGNAIEALDAPGRKSIRIDALKVPGKQCMISITDNGRGIPEGDLEKVFIPFYTTRQGGSGIGLALVRNIMRMHRGSIRVSSEPGVETTFRMVF